MAICRYCGRSIEGIVAQPRRFKAVQNSLPGIRMIKVHFVGVRAIFGTRSDKKSPSPPPVTLWLPLIYFPGLF